MLSACSWNVWGQQPTLFLQTWRFVVTLIRSHTCRTLIMWAPAEVSLLKHMLTGPTLSVRVCSAPFLLLRGCAWHRLLALPHRMAHNSC